MSIDVYRCLYRLQLYLQISIGIYIDYLCVYRCLQTSIYVYIDSYSIYIGLGIAYIEKRVFPDERVTSGLDDYAIRIFEAETGEAEVGPTPGHDNWILSVKFSTVGKLIASGSTYMTIRSQNAKMGQLEAGPFIGHDDPVQSVMFSPTGKFVASGS